MTQQPPDPVIDEIRQIRHGVSERFDHDPERLFDYYLGREKEHQEQLAHVSREAPPRQSGR